MADLNSKQIIASRIARELKDNDVVNLGIGLPTMVADYVPSDVHIILQSENGIMGMGPAVKPGMEDVDIINAGAGYVTISKNGMFFDSSTSFGLIRGGHVDITVLGSLEVDERGNLANWIVPGKRVPGMGGAMDLVVGAKKVVIAMLHTQNGQPKILKKCTLPLTAVGVVDMIVTEKCVLEVKEDGLHLAERNFEYSVEDIVDSTEAELILDGPDINMLLP